MTDLGRGYGAAGLVGAALTIGGSLGAPVMGRLVDRRGLRPVLVLTTVAEVVFWTVAQAMPYWGLLVRPCSAASWRCPRSRWPASRSPR